MVLWLGGCRNYWSFTHEQLHAPYFKIKVMSEMRKNKTTLELFKAKNTVVPYLEMYYDQETLFPLKGRPTAWRKVLSLPPTCFKRKLSQQFSFLFENTRVLPRNFPSKSRLHTQCSGGALLIQNHFEKQSIVREWTTKLFAENTIFAKGCKQPSPSTMHVSYASFWLIWPAGPQS